MKPKMKMIFALLAASCLTATPSIVLAQPVIIDSETGTETASEIKDTILEKRTLTDNEDPQPAPVPIPLDDVPQPTPIPIPLDDVPQPAPIPIPLDDAPQSTPIPLDDDNTAEDHSGHGHEAAGPHGPQRTVDNTPFALTEAPDDHVLGDDKAPITMIVYASVTCSHCSAWFTNEWPAIKKELIDSGKIRFVFRELPTAPQQMSMVGFMMAECAPSEDYFDVIQYQMENQLMMFKQAELGKAREEYNKVGKLAGLDDEDAIQACFQDAERLSHIHTNGDRATAAKVQGVPAFYINGETYKGGQSADALSEVILEMSEKGLSTLPTTLP